MKKETEEFAAEELEQERKRRESSDIVCNEHRAALEKEFGCDIQVKLMQADNFEKVRFLQQIFKEFDVDGSGEMDMREFFITLRTCGFKVSKAAAMSIMKEVDVDENGTIDMDEFIEFFKRMDDLEAFRYKVQQVQFGSGARKQILSAYIFVLLAGCFGLLVLDIRHQGQNAIVRLLFIIVVCMFFISISAVLLLPLIALKLKTQERFGNVGERLRGSLLKKVNKGDTGVTLVEPVEIPVPPPQGAIANASAEQPFSYRRAGATGRSEASKLSHRSHDVGYANMHGSDAQGQVSISAFEEKAWESADAPHIENDLALVPIDQSDMPSVVQAPSQYRRAEAQQYSEPYAGFAANGGYDISRYRQARELAAKQIEENTVGGRIKQDTNFTPWSSSRHRPLASAVR